jgi:hypothetical protein
MWAVAITRRRVAAPVAAAAAGAKAGTERAESLHSLDMARLKIMCMGSRGMKRSPTVYPAAASGSAVNGQGKGSQPLPAQLKTLLRLGSCCIRNQTVEAHLWNWSVPSAPPCSPRTACGRQYTSAHTRPGTSPEGVAAGSTRVRVPEVSPSAITSSTQLARHGPSSRGSGRLLNSPRPHQAKGVVGGPERGIQHSVGGHRVLVLIARPAGHAQRGGSGLVAGLLTGLAEPSQPAGRAGLATAAARSGCPPHLSSSVVPYSPFQYVRWVYGQPGSSGRGRNMPGPGLSSTVQVVPGASRGAVCSQRMEAAQHAASQLRSGELVWRQL